MNNPFEDFDANAIVQSFRFSNNSAALKVFLNSVLPYFALLASGFYLSEYSYWYVLALALPTHWFHARMFIIMHDCGHRSFFKSKPLNDWAGHLCAFFYLIPFLMWRELHNKHHTHQGRLKKRGLSLDVWTLTAREYKSASPLKKLVYRLYRNPIILFFIAPVVLFLFIFRVPFEKFSRSAIINIFTLNLIILCLYFLSPSGFLKWAYVGGPSLLLSYFVAAFLFYIQHQYEKTLWVTEEQSDNVWISLQGSSYVEIPPFLAWCYGNINFHNIHHLDVKIPMYNLPQAYSELQKHIRLNSLSLLEALCSYRFKLWNPQSGKMEKFPDYR